MKGNLQIKELSNQNGPDDKMVLSSFALRVKNFDDLADSKTTLPLGKTTGLLHVSDKSAFQSE